MQETVQVAVLNVLKLATIRQFDLTVFQLSDNDDYVKFIPPKFKTILIIEEASQLRHFYQQLYPLPIQIMSLFYIKSKKIALVNDLIKAGSTIMAYWPGNGSHVTNINYSLCCVGVIQYFLKHSTTFVGDATPCSFALCYVKWKQIHPYFVVFFWKICCCIINT